MSNLSLSFSFYFWWLNYALSVTLTNSLTQSVEVYPSNTVFWYGNQVESIGEAHGSDATVTITDNIYLSSNAHTVNSHANAYTLNKIDVTSFSALKTMLDAVTFDGNVNGSIFGLSSQQANGNGNSDFSSICDGGIGYITSTGSQLKTKNLSSITGEWYIRMFASQGRKTKYYAVWLE